MVRKSYLFVGLTFVFSWLLVIIFLAFGGKWNTHHAVIVAVGYMFIPTVVTIIIQKGIYKEPVKEPLGISFKFNRWFLVAWLLPPLIAFATIGITLLFPGIEYTPDMSGFLERMNGILTPEQVQKALEQTAKIPFHIFWFTLIQGLIAGITINAVAGFGEELGWRGFLQKELSPIGFWKSSILIGFIWGVWHFPLIIQGHNYPVHPFIGVFMMIAWCMLLAPIFSYIRIKSKSVIVVSILHGTLNATAGLAIIIIKGGNDLTTGVTGLPGFIILAIVNLFIFLLDHSPSI